MKTKLITLLALVILAGALIAAAPARQAGQGWEYLYVQYQSATGEALALVADSAESERLTAALRANIQTPIEVAGTTFANPAGIPVTLSQLGAEGWELVTSQSRPAEDGDTYEWILKRPAG